jgi:hypothetical protein
MCEHFCGEINGPYPSTVFFQFDVEGGGTSLVSVTDWLTSGKYCMISCRVFQARRKAERKRKKMLREKKKNFNIFQKKRT